MFGKPIFHPSDLGLLGFDDPFGESAHLWVFAIFQNDPRHIDRALVMGDHPCDEINIRIA